MSFTVVNCLKLESFVNQSLLKVKVNESLLNYK